MILVVESVLSPEELATIRASLAGARFVDGRASAGSEAQEQKHVQQLERAGDGQRDVGELVARALLRHPKVQAAALPKSVRHPNINRYEPGMHYGPHLDAPIMRGNVTTRHRPERHRIPLGTQRLQRRPSSSSKPNRRPCA